MNNVNLEPVVNYYNITINMGTQLSFLQSLPDAILT